MDSRSSGKLQSRYNQEWLRLDRKSLHQKIHVQKSFDMKYWATQMKWVHFICIFNCFRLVEGRRYLNVTVYCSTKMNHDVSNVFKLMKENKENALGMFGFGSNYCIIRSFWRVLETQQWLPKSLRLLFCSVSENANWLTFKPNPINRKWTTATVSKWRFIEKRELLISCNSADQYLQKSNKKQIKKLHWQSSWQGWWIISRECVMIFDGCVKINLHSKAP